MNKDLLVRFFVPTLPGPTDGVAGTGYPVTPDLVLTAAHVIYPERFSELKAKRDSSRPIKVLWQGDRSAQWRPLPSPEAKNGKVVVWEDEAFDAVLVRCERPDGLTGYGHLATNPPAADQRWESAGYANAARQGNERALLHCKGSTHSMASTEKDFKVRPEERTGAEGWGGASGMPVMLLTSNLILGIVTETGLRDEREVQQIKVLPASRLMERLDFRNLVRPALEEDLRNACRDDLIAFLKKSDDARLRLCRHIPSCPKDSSLSADEIVDALMDACSVQEIVKGVDAAIESGNPAGHDLDDADRILVDTLCRLLSWHWRPDPLREIRHKILSDEVVVANAPTAIPMLAEFHVAAAEARSVQLTERDTEQDFTAGPRQLAAAPNAGIRRSGSPLGTDAAQALDDLIKGKFAAENRGLLQNVAHCLAFDRVRPQGFEIDDEREQVEWIKEQLEAAKQKGRLYLLWRAPKNDDAAKNLEDGLMAIASKYHWLIILKLRHQTEVLKEVAPFLLVPRIMLRMQRDPKRRAGT